MKCLTFLDGLPVTDIYMDCNHGLPVTYKYIACVCVCVFVQMYIDKCIPEGEGIACVTFFLLCSSLPCHKSSLLQAVCLHNLWRIDAVIQAYYDNI